VSTIDRAESWRHGMNPSALHELDFILDQTPFDVLGTAEVDFAPPS
jgi:hypothetical protein